MSTQIRLTGKILTLIEIPIERDRSSFSASYRHIEAGTSVRCIVDSQKLEWLRLCVRW